MFALLVANWPFCINKFDLIWSDLITFTQVLRPSASYKADCQCVVGSPCANYYEFRCPGGTQQCIGDYYLCNGNDDCGDNSDEYPSFCRLNGQLLYLTIPDTVSCTFTTYHTWQFIIFTIFTITACIFSYSLSISFWTQDWLFSISFPPHSTDLFLSYRTDYTDSRTI